MFRLIKSQLAEFSYFLEKYFNITSIIWSILFVALIHAVILIVVVKIAEIIYERKKQKKKSFFSIYIICISAIGFIMNVLISQAYTWDNKLQRVMQNYKYIMAFDSNRRAVFNALSLPDNTINNNSMFNMAMYLNDNQWNIIKNAIGDSSWYFAKVQKAIAGILKIGDCHLSLGVIYQGAAAFVPIIFIIAIGLIFLIRRQILPGVLIIISGGMCVLGNFGAGIFMLLTLCLGIILDKWLDISIQNLKKNMEKRKKKSVEPEEINSENTPEKPADVYFAGLFL